MLIKTIHIRVENKEKYKIFNVVWLLMWSPCPQNVPTLNNPLIKGKKKLQ